MTWRVIEADCIEAMQQMEDSSVDAICTDPPYGLEFMGKEWDRLGAGFGQPGIGDRPTAWVSQRGWNEKRCTSCGHLSHGGSPCHCDAPNFAAADGRWRRMQEWHEAWATEALRVLKPGGHLLAFGGTRTYHRLACAIEDAGFEIRDCLAWMYGSGFPKSLDVSKAIDKAAGAEREVVGRVQRDAHLQNRYADPESESLFVGDTGHFNTITAPATPDAEQWQGWGTALKPAFEPIVMARKSLVGTVAANVLEHGTGALNIDGTRIDTNDGADLARQNKQGDNGWKNSSGGPNAAAIRVMRNPCANCEHGISDHAGNPPFDNQCFVCSCERFRQIPPLGRWPANVVLDEAAAALLDEQTGETRSTGGQASLGAFRGGRVYGAGRDEREARDPGFGDFGGASRFFYVAKSASAERNRGLEHRTDRSVPNNAVSRADQDNEHARRPNRTAVANTHPTVKPVELMQWLCRLVTPPGGVVLDPFTGSGSTGIAALREGFGFVGIEREAEYVEIARDRIIGDAPLFNVAGEVVA